MKKDDELLRGAIAFHGHLGPYLVLGLKAGIHANRIFGRNPMKMHAHISTNPAPPQSCSADGVQFSTGCTLGKNNIEVVNGTGLTIVFTYGEQKLALNLKSEIIEEMRKLPSIESEWENLARNFYHRDIETLFTIN